jgi:predicted RNA polymerase sigma factor
LRSASTDAPTAAGGTYRVQAEIQAVHARARTADDTDWRAIVGWYDVLLAAGASPVVELNRAVAHGMAFGPAVGLAIADRVQHEPSLREYPYLPGVRADLLFKLQRFEEARAEFMHAASLTNNTGQKRLLLEKAAECS